MTEAALKFNSINATRLIKWEGLSDGGKWNRAIECMEEFAKDISKDRDYYKSLSEKACAVINSAKKEPEYLRKNNDEWNEWNRNSWKPAIEEYEALKSKKL